MYRLILILLCLSSCAAQKHCKTRDKDFENAFNRRLLLVQQLEERSAVVGVDDYMETIWYLSKLTGIVSRADISSTLGYRNHAAYSADMAAWKKWLRQNKCGYTQAKTVLNIDDSAVVRSFVQRTSLCHCIDFVVSHSVLFYEGKGYSSMVLGYITEATGTEVFLPVSNAGLVMSNEQRIKALKDQLRALKGLHCSKSME